MALSPSCLALLQSHRCSHIGILPGSKDICRALGESRTPWFTQSPRRHMTFATGARGQMVEIRKCGKCSLCCKVMRIDELARDPGVWCKGCAPGKGGCKIYDDRPTSCRGFLCLWLVNEDLGPDWFPATAKLVVSIEGEGRRVAISVDPAFPSRGQEEPFYSMIKEWGARDFDLQRQVIVN
jgi:hypothetical protein